MPPDKRLGKSNLILRGFIFQNTYFVRFNGEVFWQGILSRVAAEKIVSKINQPAAKKKFYLRYEIVNN